MLEDNIKKAKEKIDLARFVESVFGKPKKAGGSLRWSQCPACGDGGKASSRLAIRSGGAKFHCFACGERGDLVDFASLYWGEGAVESAKRLLGGDVTIVERDIKREEKEKKAEDDKAIARKEMVARLFAELPNLVVNVEAMKYFAIERMIGKKVMMEALERKILAFLPSDPAVANALLLEIVGEDILTRAEVLKDSRRLMNLAYRPAVIFAHGGKSAEFRIGRAAKEGETKALRYGGAGQPWWWQGEGKTCVITEGAVDMWSQVALGFKGHVMGLPSSNNYQPRWFEGLAKSGIVDKFVIRLDNDQVKNPNAQVKSGNVWADNIHNQLNEFGINNIVRLPAAGDVNDELRLWRELKR